MIIGRNSRGRSPGSRKCNRPPGGARRLSKLDALDGLGAALGQDSRAHTLASPMPGEKPASTGRWKQSCTIHQKSGLAALVVSFWPEGLRVIETRSEARWKGLPLAGTLNASVVVSAVLPACGVVLRSLLDRH